MKSCRICKDETAIVFNIGFKAVPICDGCANSITIQQVHWLMEQEREKKRQRAMRKKK